MSRSGTVPGQYTCVHNTHNVCTYVHYSISGKRHVLVCWDNKDGDDTPLSVSAVPALQVSTTRLLEDSIGKPCRVQVEGSAIMQR